MKFMIQTAMLIIAVIYTGAANAFGETDRSSTTESTAQQFGFDQVEIISQTGSTRGTGYIENNKILTMDGKMHVTWLDAGLGGPEPVRIRTFDLKSGEWSATYTLGEAYDNHGSPTIVNDGDGYLHAVFDGHFGPLCYRRSVRPQ